MLLTLQLFVTQSMDLCRHIFGFSAGLGFTCLYNVLNFPAGVAKVTRVTQQDVDNLKDYPTDALHRALKEVCVTSSDKQHIF